MHLTNFRALPVSSSQQPFQSVMRPARRHSVRQALRPQATSAPLKEMVHASEETSVKGLNKISRTVTQPKSQGASQAMLYATGLTKQDLDKPQVWQGLDCAAEQAGQCNICRPADQRLHGWLPYQHAAWASATSQFSHLRNTTAAGVLRVSRRQLLLQTEPPCLIVLLPAAGGHLFSLV